MINKDTKLCISIAQYPSSIGTIMHNASFKFLKLNYIYKACQVNPDKLHDAILGIVALKIRGCGISMPFKEEALNYCNSLDNQAKRIGAINTIINNNGQLRGYNTDYYGVLKSLQNLQMKRSTVVLLGAGGVARAIICALRKLNIKQITICNRTEKNALALSSKHNLKVSKWQERHLLKADILINATPIGMRPNENLLPINESSINNYKMIVDLVINPLESLLIKKAKVFKKNIIPGYQICLYQAAKQFELYTGMKTPIHIMQNALIKLIGSSVL